MKTELNIESEQKTRMNNTVKNGRMPQEYHEVYVVCDQIPKQYHSISHTDLFQGVVANINQFNMDYPIFLNQQSAVQYGRALGSVVLIVKAYVPGLAVVGCSSGLILKKGYLNQSNIANGFVIRNGEALYLDNFHFDKRIWTN
jgi:hypothetical protein